MKSFFLVYSLIGLMCVFTPQDSLGSDGWARSEWWSSVVEKNEFIATSQDGKLKLIVALKKPDGVTEKEIKTTHGEETRFFRNGSPLPPDFWPGRNMLTKFEFYWNGKRVPIEDRFWRDLYGFRIQISTIDPKSIAGALHDDFQEFLNVLEQPHVILSTEGGTALIEWVRPEECDARSIVRWIITEDGRVLRHHVPPPSDWD